MAKDKPKRRTCAVCNGFKWFDYEKRETYVDKDGKRKTRTGLQRTPCQGCGGTGSV